MIQFKCSGCGTTLRLKDETAGRKGKCPKCGIVLEVPSPPLPRDDTESDASAGVYKPVRYKCAHCGLTLETAQSLAGKEDRCPHCRKTHTVPLSSTVGAKATLGRAASSARGALKEMSEARREKRAKRMKSQASLERLAAQTEKAEQTRQGPDSRSAAPQRVSVSPAGPIVPSPVQQQVPAPGQPAGPSVVAVPVQPQSISQTVIVQQQRKGASGFGVASLVIGILAIIGCWIPILNVVSLLFGGLGAILGFVGLLVSAIGRRSGVGLPIAGLVLSLVAVVVAILVLGLFAAATASG